MKRSASTWGSGTERANQFRLGLNRICCWTVTANGDAAPFYGAVEDTTSPHRLDGTGLRDYLNLESAHLWLR